MERDPIIPINADDLAFIEELEQKAAPDGGETVLPLPCPRGPGRG
jgi:hypothetical protein